MIAAVPQSGVVGDTESALRGLGRTYDEALAMEAVVGSTVEISGEALGGFASKRYDPVTGGDPAGPR